MAGPEEEEGEEKELDKEKCKRYVAGVEKKRWFGHGPACLMGKEMKENLYLWREYGDHIAACCRCMPLIAVRRCILLRPTHFPWESKGGKGGPGQSGRIRLFECGFRLWEK